MKSITSLVIILLLGLSLNVDLSGQIADNFEFLNHNYFQSFPSAVKLHKEEIYYSSIHQDQPLTTVLKVSADKSVETLLELPWSSAAKIFELTDSSFQIVLYSLLDYDLFMPGFMVVNVSENETSIDTILGFNFDDPSELGVLGHRYDLFIPNIEKDENGDWLTLGSDSIYHINSTGIVSSTYLEDGQFFYNAFSNVDEKKFTILHNHNVDQSIVLQLVDDKLDTIGFIPSTSLVTNWLNTSHGNYIETSDELLLYSIDFQTILDRWRTSLFQGEITHFNNEDTSVEFITTTGLFFQVYEIDENGTLEFKAEQEINSNEKLHSFHKIDSKQYLFSGQYGLPPNSQIQQTSQVFLRNVNINDKNAVNYPGVDISLIEMELIATGMDTFSFWVTLDGDTTYQEQYDYEIRLTLENNGSDTMNIANIFSERKGFVFGRSNVFNEEVYDIPPGEQLEYFAVFKGFADPIRSITLQCPGADYMFNRGDGTIKADTQILSSKDLEKNNPLTIYPNPTSDLLFLDEEEPIESIVIYNLSGRIVYYSNGGKKQIHISCLPAGSYTLGAKIKNSKTMRFNQFLKI